jgi:predicted nucleic acid-binding protein
MILLDTCVISEGIKPRPDPEVLSWMKYQNPTEFYISAVTLGELHYGVAKVKSSNRQRELADWVGTVEERFSNRVIVLDDAVARQWGYLRAAKPSIAVADGQIAATAIAYGFTFATRNVKHFAIDGLQLVNPWDA